MGQGHEGAEDFFLGDGFEDFIHFELDGSFLVIERRCFVGAQLGYGDAAMWTFGLLCLLLLNYFLEE